MRGSQSIAYDDEDDEEEEESHINWSDVIFLPFNPVFKMFVLVSVIVKSTLGPMRSIFSLLHCDEIIDQYLILSILKDFYWYLADFIYSCDTFLHIAHRQVTEKAMRRKFLPKSAFLLLLDVISLIPFYTLTANESCPPIQLWPNMLAFSEFIIVYRIVQHFSMVSSHNIPNLVMGFSILAIVCANCLGCLLILLTVNGLCENCRNVKYYDWRKYVVLKLNETDEGFTTYVYGTSFVMGFVLNNLFDETKPAAVLEFWIVTIFMIAGFALDIYVVLPKIFSESIMRLRRICTYQPVVQKIVEETKRRNPSSTAHIDVSKFYNLMWNKRKGITNIPDIITDLPRYLRLEIKQDLVWPVFYHSPTLRNTSAAFKRWICEFICLDYKLPGEKFFAGPHCHTNLYYLKSGIIELLSADDGVTPLLSLSGGTILGDVSFMVPPLKRNLVVRCVTYCEVFILCRYDILKAMQKYPPDRKYIMASVKDRIKHARTLYTCKQHVRGLDRAEDEGIAWIKRRWWEISDAVSNWKQKPHTSTKYDLPPEENVYHCAKYIGQLVLCSEVQLHKKSLFANTNFPWILTPNSSFGRVWHIIVMVTVFLAVVMYPPNITRKKIRTSFKIIRCWVDFIYICDIFISLLTSTKKEIVSVNYATVMFTRCKSIKFVLDVFATVWIELLPVLADKPELYYLFQFNRLLKVYILFESDQINSWSLGKEVFITVCYKALLANFCYYYISAYVMYTVKKYLPGVTTAYFFGVTFCNKGNQTVICDPGDEFFGVPIAYAYETLFFEYAPYSLTDIYFASVLVYIEFLVNMITKGRFISYLYLKYRETTNYQWFVSNLKKYYKNHKIHQNLMKRLERYMICQWKYYQGADVMHPSVLKNEPFDIYWKVHGEVAEKIIRESQAFVGADPMLVRELAYAAKFYILPKNATIFLFGVQCRTVTWIVQGHIKCEYHNEDGELLKRTYNPGQMVSVSAVLLRKPSLRTYASCTECELLNIPIHDFFHIIKRYPDEWSYFQNCIEEFSPMFTEIFEAYVKKHRDYQKKLRARVFHARTSIVQPTTRNTPVQNDEWTPMTVFGFQSWLDPDSEWMFYWAIFRVITVVISIASTSLQGGSGAPIRRNLIIISSMCDGFAWVDITLKLFISYYDERGILIYNSRMCITHYLRRGFFLDIIGAIPWSEFIMMIVTSEINEAQAMLINTFCKFAHIYIVMAFFNYIADQPNVNGVYILILKWQLVIVLVMLGGSHFLMNNCIYFQFDSRGNLVSMESRKGCWFPSHMAMEKHPSVEQLHLIFAQSLNLAQSALMRMNLGKFHINRSDVVVGLVLVILGVIFWYVMCYSLTLLILATRGNTLFQHGVNQLQKFLKAERVDQKLIKEATSHFGYWWMRNKGINIQHLMNERIGVVFKQDLSYYFFKKTFKALDTLLRGGEPLERQLSSIGQQKYLRPGQEVMREMDLTPLVFVVHRGKITISKDGQKLADLTKGGIFGQLNGTEPRPVTVSAVANGYADILQMSIEDFQDVITDEVRANIACNHQSKLDFMAVKRPVKDNPYNTVEYILRGRKTIKLPWMKEPMEACNGSWYTRWLFLVWLIVPFFTSVLVMLLCFVPEDVRTDLDWALFALDIVFLANFIAEFFTVEMAVVDDVLVERRLEHRLLLYWGFYMDSLSLFLPLSAPTLAYDFARLLRLRLLYEFNTHFCNSFKSKLTPILMKFIIVCLLVHFMVCGWIYVACRKNPGEKFPVHVSQLTEGGNATIDTDEWMSPQDRHGGCARMVMYRPNKSLEYQVSFLVPRNWQNDYIIAFMYITLLQTHVVMDTVVALTITEIYYKIFVSSFILLLNIWLVSLAIGAVYTMFRELYQYDYGVSNLTTYLHYSGLAPTLIQSIEEYTRQLWQRQRGNWLPELAKHAPQCLREDLFSALYIHHLHGPVVFRNLPDYFARQLVARFQRVVIFPGKCIIQEGDIFPCMYFIHEGEIEKWYCDASGEKKFMSLLTTNGYFGVIPGLYPNVPFLFTYYSRTVVDLVYLRLGSWQDLLEGYPAVRRELYSRAEQLKKELMKSKNI